MDASPPGLLLWTQRCSGGITEGAALVWSICFSCWTAVWHVPAVPCRLGRMLTCPTISETRRYTKLPSPEERYGTFALRALFRFFRFFAPLCCVVVALKCKLSIKPIIQPPLIRRLSCCCCTMTHVPLSSMGTHRFPKMSLKIQRSEACWKVRAACQGGLVDSAMSVCI